MKKYIKPAIEMVEANLSANYLQGTSGPDIDSEVGGGTMNSPKRKVYVVDDEEYDDEEGFGW